MLMELPTDTETNDNVVACWRPRRPYAPGEAVRLSYRVRSVGGDALHPGARVVNTFVAATVASGTAKAEEAQGALSRRFLIDFAGGDLAYYRADPSRVEVIASASDARVTATSLVANPHTGGLRAAIDVLVSTPGQATDLRAFLRAGGRALSETWIYSWTAA
jgi:glucans biosynthesis protein